MTNRWTWLLSERYSVDWLALLVLRAGCRLFCWKTNWDAWEIDGATRRLSVTHVSIFADLFRFVDQTLRNHPEIVGLWDEYVGQLTALSRHSHLGWDVVLVGRMNEARWEERRCCDSSDVVDRHLVEALQIDDELKEAEEFAHRVAVLVRQEKAQHWDCSGLIVSWESWLGKYKLLVIIV